MIRKYWLIILPGFWSLLTKNIFQDDYVLSTCCSLSLHPCHPDQAFHLIPEMPKFSQHDEMGRNVGTSAVSWIFSPFPRKVRPFIPLPVVGGSLISRTQMDEMKFHGFEALAELQKDGTKKPLEEFQNQNYFCPCDHM